MTPRLGERNLHRTLGATVYANFAGMSPLSIPVRAAIDRSIAALAELGAAAGWGLLSARDALREKAGQLVGVRADEIGLVPNTTTGVRAVAFGLRWRPGARVVCFEGEFPANVTPWQQAAAMTGGSVTMLPLRPWFDAVDEGLAQLDRTLAQGGVLAVAVSAVQFSSGLRMPLSRMAEVCHRHGALLAVDAIQGCGVVPIDCVAEGIDTLACGGHKWLGGAMGIGFLAIREHAMAQLEPRLSGWTSHEDAVSFLLEGPGHLRHDRPIRRRADFVEDGGSAIALVPGLVAAIDLLLELGVPAIFDHVQAWIDAAEAGLFERGFTSLRAREPSARSGILGVVPPVGSDVVAMHQHLERLGVACAIPDGVLRFAPHWSNGIDEIPELLRCVDLTRSERAPG